MDTRKGPRPSTRPRIPHQQLSQNAPAHLQEELWRRMAALDGVTTGPSGISLPDTRALHLTHEPVSEVFLIGREFAHLHGAADGSLHMVLSPGDTEAAIAAGWAERHPVAPSVIMVYGPRDDQELETVWRLVERSYAYVAEPAT
ncbi:luciferase family protein [Nonomuraea sp. NPDC050556]|uniref:luciferase domain-containing protein n=1 Tax=Nonomuraea sp. NPDC050556 TaxID=3364369 RepID=UPI0037B0E3FC